MRAENQGLQLWTDDADAPGHVVEAGADITVTIGVTPVDTSNRVELLYRVNGGATRSVPARWLRNDPAGRAQYFRAGFPGFRPGDTVDYTAVCRCAGRQVPEAAAAEQFTSSFRVASEPQVAAALRDHAATLPTSQQPAIVAAMEPLVATDPGVVASPRPSGEPATGPIITRDQAAPPRSSVPPATGVGAVTLQLVGERTGEPLAGRTVYASDSDADQGPGSLGAGVTGEDGSVTLTWTTAPPITPSDAQANGPVRRLRLHIAAPQGAAHETEVQIRPRGEPAAATVIRLPERPVPTVEDAAATLPTTASPALLEHLATRGIRTLADVREAGGLARLPELPVAGDDPAVRLLDAHGQFSTLPTDSGANATLIAAGYTHLLDIAETPAERFAAAVGEALGGKAAAVHAAAEAQARLLTTAVTDTRVSAPAGLLASLASATVAPHAQVCGCRECLNATSPLAYLVDLLDYAVRHLRKLTGLRGVYYTRPDLTGLKLSRRDATVDFDWDTGRPDPSIPSGPFSVRWTGQVQARFTGLHTFFVRSQDGVRLWVDGRKLVDDWTDHPVAERSGSLGLQHGRWYDLILEYYRRAGPGSVQLSWSEAGLPKQLVPERQLRAPGPGADLDLAMLVELFQQPFDRLPASCEAAEQRVRQIRICVEVLRGYLARPTPHQQAYLDTAYRMLLERIGTSFEELRRVMAGNRPDRIALARRLRITLQPKRQPTDCDELDLLFCDPRCLGTGGPTEEALEHLFGLPRTDGDPLQPAQAGQVGWWRTGFLEQQWRREDAVQRPLGELPMVDPDIVDSDDLVDPIPTPAKDLPTRKAKRPMDFWEDRAAWSKGQLNEIDLGRRAAGLDAVIKDPFIGLPDPVSPRKVSLAELQDLRNKRLAEQHGEVDARLRELRLDDDALTYLVTIASLDPATVLDREWEQVYAILLQSQKRARFADWVKEEQAAKIHLGPKHFRLRPLPRDGGRRWMPLAWRASWEVRRHWQDTLRVRAKQHQAVWEELREAVRATEEATLGGLRDDLVFAAAGSSGSEGADWVTRRLGIDGGMDACQMTTRVEQAIATLQAILFAARQRGLDGRLVLGVDAARFDEAWRWLGSYDTWRAAMQVFLYPEGALRPTLRRRRSLAFEAFVKRERSAGRTTPQRAQAQAAEYASYFADVCSLDPAALYDTASPIGMQPTPGGLARYVVAVARAAASGKSYFSTYTLRLKPSVYAGLPPVVLGVFDQTLWAENPLPVGSEIIGMAPYQQRGSTRLGVYARTRTDGTEALFVAAYDGSNWSVVPVAGALPALVRSAELPAGVVRASPAPAGDPAEGWSLQGGDQLVGVDVDGDGRREIVAFAAPGQDGRRRVAVLRERDGGLVVDWSGSIDGGWRLPDERRPVILPTVLNTWPWRAERLLLVHPTGPQLGVLGWRDGALAVLWSTTDPGGGPVALSTSIDGQVHPTVFVAADLAGGGTRVLAFEHRLGDSQWSRVKTVVTVLDWGGDRLVFRAFQDLKFPQDLPAHPYWSDGFDMPWERFVPVRSGFGPGGFEGGSAQDILVLANRVEYTREGGPGELDRWVGIPQLWVGTLRWDWHATPEFPNGHFVLSTRYWKTAPAAAGQNERSWAADDELLPLDPGGASPSQEILAWSPSREAVAVLRYGSAGKLEVAWQATDRITRAGGGGLDWDLRAGDRFIPADVDGDGVRELVVASADGGRIGVLALSGDHGLAARWVAQRQVDAPQPWAVQAWRLTPAQQTRYLPADLDGDGHTEVAVFAPDRRIGILRGVPRAKTAVQGLPAELGPKGVTALDIIPRRSEGQVDARRRQIADAYAANQKASATTFVYLDEAYYFVPVELALRLSESGEYAAALDWFRSTYDYGRPTTERKIAYNLVREASLGAGFERVPEWITDPLNPHLVASTRRHSYTRYTILATVRCLLDYADAEYTQGTAASVERARSLYLLALELLEAPELQERAPACSDLIGHLEVLIGPARASEGGGELLSILGAVHDHATVAEAVQQIEAVLAQDGDWPIQLAQARAISVAASQQAPARPPLAEVLRLDAQAARAAATALLAEPLIAQAAEQAGVAAGAGLTDGDRQPPTDGPQALAGERADSMPEPGSPGAAAGYAPAPSFQFCIPPNPAVAAARSRARLNLFKIRSCRDIAGIAQTEPRRPSQYRFAVLIERAKALVAQAASVEAAMLHALERRDQEYYELLRARQHVELARAGVQLQGLRVRATQNKVLLTELQQERAQMQVTTYDERIKAGLNQWERAMVRAYERAAWNQGAAAAFGIYGGIIAGFSNPWAAIGGIFQLSGAGFASQAAVEQSRAYIAGVHASHERQKADWELAKRLAEQDVVIAATQAALAEDDIQVEQQQHAIAQLQAEHAQVLADFLATKFTSFDLYDLMSNVLQDVYRFFLQQATAVARVAADQLAFERQEAPPSIIRADYWQLATEQLDAGTGDAGAGDRRGLTGSARLARDIYQLDQYAFQTNRQKQQLTKVISLADLDPYAFERFRETGVLRFSTPMELFDADHPGQYLRLIRRVRCSLIALVPPTQGIHATLSTTGLSRVVTGDEFEAVVVRREPETVALSSPMNTTGRFDLEPPPDVPLPFEWMGVDTAWEFELPKAANLLDYRTIATLLVTMEYTALDSAAYRQQVLRRLGGTGSLERPFSMRDELVDQWYELHNANPSAPAISVTFETRREDFPPNLERLAISRLVLYFARAPGASFAIDVKHLRFTPQGSTAAFEGPGTDSDGDGLISSRPGGGGAWDDLIWDNTGTAPQRRTPVGRWELAFANTQELRNRFTNEQIENIVFVITYTAEPPAWPA